MALTSASGGRSARGPLSTVLLMLAALSLLVGTVGLYVWVTVVSPDRFVDRFDRLRAEPAVQQELSVAVAAAIVDAAPDLVSVRPLLEQVAAGVIASDAAGPVFRYAARNLHDAVLNPHRDDVVLELADLGVVVAAALRAVDPKLAEQVPAHLETALVTVSNHGVETTLPRTVRQIRGLTVVGLAGSVLLVAAAIAVSPQRRAAVASAGLTVAGAAVAMSAIVFAVKAWLSVRADPENADLAGAVWTVFVRPLVGWAVPLALLGAVVTATTTATRPVDIGGFARRAAAILRRPPRTRPSLAARGLILGAAGVLVAVQPLAVLTVLTVAAGFVLGVYGLIEVTNAVNRRPAVSAEQLAPFAPKSRSFLLRAAIPGVAALLIVVVAMATITRELRVGPAAATEDDGPLRCNGFAQLCDRTLDKVALAATHNSMSAALEPGWYLAEQQGGITAQLDFGIRGFLIDTHYARIASDGSVRTDLSSFADARAALAAEFGEPAVAAAERLAARAGIGGGTGPRRPYLCHSLCELGATSFDTALSDIDAWLTAHPHEVIILFIQDAITPADTAAAFERTGLIHRVYTPAQPAPEIVWPTLREMIQRDTRVVVLAEHTPGGPAYPWYQDGFAVAQETAFDVRSVDDLSCAPNRGGTVGSLFLLNHWLSGTDSPIEAADQFNARKLLLNRAEQCQRERRHVPNLIAVNFYDHGDLLDVVSRLNGIDRQAG